MTIKRTNTAKPAASGFRPLGVWEDITVENQVGVVRAKLDAYLAALTALAAASEALDNAASAKMRSDAVIGKTHAVHFHKGRFGKVSFIVNDVTEKRSATAKKPSGFTI
jgi:hypothetical protein